MKRFVFILFSILMSFNLFAQRASYEEMRDSIVFKDKNPDYEVVKNTSFVPGEEIEFKATFGWFTVGKARLKTSSRPHMMNGRACWKVDAIGKTTGFVDWLAKVDDYWGAYVDTSSMVAQQATRILKEGNYRKHEITDYYHEKDYLTVTNYSNKRKEWRPAKYFDAPNDVRDMLSGYFYVRNIDFSKLQKGDTVKINGFLEDTFYDLSVIYGGKEKIKTKAGTFRTIKIIPVMPENSLFDGADSVVSWLSDDENKIPIKLSAKMFIGNAGVEITGYKNLRHKPNIVK